MNRKFIILPFLIILLMNACKKEKESTIMEYKTWPGWRCAHEAYLPGAYFIFKDELGNYDSLYVYRTDSFLTYDVVKNEDTINRYQYHQVYYRNVDMQTGIVKEEFTNAIGPYGVKRNTTNPGELYNGQWIAIDTLLVSSRAPGCFYSGYTYHETFWYEYYNIRHYVIDYDESTLKVFPSTAYLDYVLGIGYYRIRYKDAAGVNKTYELMRSNRKAMY